MNTYWKKWRFVSTEKGRQYWEYLGNEENARELELMQEAFRFDKSENANSADKVYRFLATEGKTDSLSANNKAESFKEQVSFASRKAMHFYEKLLTENNFITGDYGGPMFLLPGLIIVSYTTNTPLANSYQALIKAYLFNQQNEDGGWGLHIEAKSDMFGTCMNYVALRLLGLEKEDPRMKKAQAWIYAHGGATNIPSWGKFYLSVLNVYSWKGNNSLFPEMWLLPKWLPFYPAKYWCHARMVYLAMAYCYGNKIEHPLNDLTLSLRKELYLEAYESIDWVKARNACAETDTFRKSSPLLKVLNGITSFYENFAPKFLRKKALKFILAYIQAEDEHTNYINIGPVNQVINSLAMWHAHGKESAEFKMHVEHWKDYLWLAEDGIKMQGYNGAQFWETAFTMNAINESELGLEFSTSLANMYQFIDTCQIQEGIPQDKLFFRHPNEGGWPFSTVEHAWPITDCTADGIKTVIRQHQFSRKGKLQLEENVSFERLAKAVDLVLSFQSKDGGWASYEKRRAPFWIEMLNPSEVFGEIMVDYSYTECSSSSIQGLYYFHKEYPDYKATKIKKAIAKGISFIKGKQGADGSWYGSWGVCYTYGAWFGLEALACGEEFYSNSQSAKNACDFLISKQRTDGSWGESFESCVKMEYVQHKEGQIINTAWALLGLMQAQYPNKAQIDKGIQFILSRQEESGDFPQEGISGVFNKNCMETYTSYRNVFPIWALSRYLGLNK